MKTIKYDKENLIEIKKSKFIGYTFFCESIDDANKYLTQVRELHKKATHVCFAYVVNSNEKASDDGEPQGTAGIPILDVIKKQKLTNVLCIVVRYFGGIKLGAGGLVRAYSETASSTIALSETADLEKAKQYCLVVNYGQENVINNLKNNDNVIDIKIDYNDKIVINILTINDYVVDNAKLIEEKMVRV